MNELRGSDWGNFVLRLVSVVFGILIAFTLNDWARDRGDERREVRLLERMKAEAESDVAYLRARRDASEMQLLEWQRLALALSKDSQCPAASEWPNLYPIDRFPAVVPPNAVLEEIVSAGGLAELEDTRIRAVLAAYHARLNFVQAESRAFESSRLVAPGDPRIRVRYEPSENEPVALRYEAPALCDDPAFIDRLVFAVRNQQRILDEVNRLLDDGIRMCATLGEALGNGCTPTGGPALDGAEKATADEAVEAYRR